MTEFNEIEGKVLEHFLAIYKEVINEYNSTVAKEYALSDRSDADLICCALQMEAARLKGSTKENIRIDKLISESKN